MPSSRKLERGIIGLKKAQLSTSVSDLQRSDGQKESKNAAAARQRPQTSPSPAATKYLRANPVPNSLRVDEKRLQQSATPFDPVSKVLDDDDLLIEILLVIACPTTLVFAALVCKRWLCHASDPAFLYSFSKLHSPRLLGFYVNTRMDLLRFVPMLPQPPEFDVVIRRASSILDTHKLILDDRNDIISTNKFKNCDEEPKSIHIVPNPLCPERAMVSVPLFPCHERQEGYFHTSSRLLFKEEGDGFSYVYLDMESDGTKSRVHIYMLQGGVWCVHASATTQLPCQPLKLNTLLADNKIYMEATLSEILVLDLIALSFSTFHLPQGLLIGDHGTMLSRADDDTGVYLIHLEEARLCIWLRTGDNWLLVDTICFHEMCAQLGMSDITNWLFINQVGGNAEFLFLQMGHCLVYVGIKCRKLCKVLTSKDQWWGRIHPCMMIWPPTFPALKNDPPSDAM
ncbi:uncharacterized protein [Aegilops tauschii subsp. strangulata]|uniref:uncharacterized protein isoform X3 n=1 Tax=Aegilops tauschii subsp. strangulata TaxID=200361 RepID=UPI001E1CA7A4|nr:uncharacterized protein LOC109781674 isoform X2 [Aegilops tauschii subsp. strangulata]